MDDSGVYAAACEVRDAVNSLTNELNDQLAGLTDELLAGRLARRDRWAGQLFTQLVADGTARGVLSTEGITAAHKNLAARAWELADALDAADPQKQKRDALIAKEGQRREV